VQLVHRGLRFGGLTPEGQTALTWAKRIVEDTLNQTGFTGEVGVGHSAAILAVSSAL
jgi:hypothetical protein